jgi:peptidoglycan/xylan/chitin deacetylase (PgdA/CDA1 family)
MSQRNVHIWRRLLPGVARRVTGTITHVATHEPVAALTFDDGPHPDFTPRLLDILARYQAHATFFMIGLSASRYPELVRDVAQAGHAIGNHSWDHPSFPLITGRERRAQMRACAQAIAPYGQRLFRPPYGHQSVASRIDALWLRHRVVTWNLVAYDWLDRGAGWMIEQVTSHVRPGSIILFHDTLWRPGVKQAADRGPALQAIDAILEQLGDRFHFVTVPELLQHGRPQLANWYRKPDLEWLNRPRD